MKIEISMSVVCDISHRFGKLIKMKYKVGPIILKFTLYVLQHQAFVSKKVLKDKETSVTESLIRN